MRLDDACFTGNLGTTHPDPAYNDRRDDAEDNENRQDFNGGKTLLMSAGALGMAFLFDIQHKFMRSKKRV